MLKMESYIKKFVAIFMVVIIAVLLVATLANAYQTVPSGFEGVVLQWGNPVRTTGSGLQTITPFVEDIVNVNVQTQSATAQESAASSDLQRVQATVTVNYQLDAAFAKEIYINLRDEYQSRVIIPAMQDALKASTAKFQATELITQREVAKTTFQDLLQQKLNQYHINVNSVSITDFQFSDSFTTAIEAKVTAEQNALAAQNQLQVVQFQAQQQIIQATANATAISMQAMGSANATVINANATAQAIQIIQSQLTPSYIQYLYAIGWDGKLPIYWVTGGNSTAPYLLIQTQQSINATTP
jgi:regulator of protease activity HflC (stomatin/prohibitin superfamily)